MNIRSGWTTSARASSSTTSSGDSHSRPLSWTRAYAFNLRPWRSRSPSRWDDDAIVGTETQVTEATALWLERCPLLLQPRLEPLRAVAVATRPRLAAIFIAAPAARMRVLDRVELKEFFPVRLLFLQRRRTEAGLQPLHAA